MLYVIRLIGLRCKLICSRNRSRMSIMMQVQKWEWLSDLKLRWEKMLPSPEKTITLVLDTAGNKTKPFLAGLLISVVPSIWRNVKHRNADFSQEKASHVMRLCAGINWTNFGTRYTEATVDLADGVVLKIQSGCEWSAMLLYSVFNIFLNIRPWNSDSGRRIYKFTWSIFTMTKAENRSVEEPKRTSLIFSLVLVMSEKLDKRADIVVTANENNTWLRVDCGVKFEWLFLRIRRKRHINKHYEPHCGIPDVEELDIWCRS